MDRGDRGGGILSAGASADYVRAIVERHFDERLCLVREARATALVTYPFGLSERDVAIGAFVTGYLTRARREVRS